MRVYKRWVSCFGDKTLEECVDIARDNGMKCISANKYSMCVHFQIGLYGTSDAMQKTQEEWESFKNHWVNRQPRGAFRVGIPKLKTDWIDWSRTP